MTSAASMLPPRALAKIKRLMRQERLIYVQELIGSYGSKVLEYDRILSEYKDNYIRNQRAHFQILLEELEAIMDAD